jgi:hypothetical protein
VVVFWCVLGACNDKTLNAVDCLSGFNILEQGACPYFSRKMKRSVVSYDIQWIFFIWKNVT